MLKRVDTRPEKKTTGTCDRTGCHNKGEWYPVLLLYAPKILYPNAPPAPAKIFMSICSDCKEVIKVDDLISGPGWERIVAQFRKLKRVEPNRLHTKLTWERIGHES